MPHSHTNKHDSISPDPLANIRRSSSPTNDLVEQLQGTSLQQEDADPSNTRTPSLISDSSSGASTGHLDTHRTKSINSKAESSTSRSSHGSQHGSFASSITRSILPHKHKASSDTPHPHVSRHPSLGHSTLNTPPKDPIALCELAVTTSLTFPGPTVSELKKNILPEYFHVEGYSHRVNCREVDFDGFMEILTWFRKNYRSVRVRHKLSYMDSDGSASLQQAAVALTYDLVCLPLHGHKHEIEEKRTTCFSIVKMFDGKIAQDDIVVDTLPFKKTETEVACSIM